MIVRSALSVLLLVTLLVSISSANVPNNTLLTKGLFPLWSPSGDRVAYIAPNGRVAIIDGSGESGFILAQFDEPAQVEAWSPDEKNLIIEVGDGHVLIDTKDGKPQELLRPSQNAGIVRWSPDGKYIAYLSSTENKTQIWTMNLNGQSKKQLLEIDHQKYQVTQMEWSPDSRKLAISTNTTWIIDLPNMTNTVVSNSTVSSAWGRGAVVWHPNSHSVYLTDERFGRPDVVELSLSGDLRARLTSDDAAELQLSLDRSGSKLAYLNITPGNYSNREAPNSSIWVLDVSTGERFQVHPPGGIQIPLGYIHRLHLHPSANKILFAQEAADIMILDFSPTQVPGKFVESPGVSSGQTPPKQTPGFEAVAAVAAILLVAYLRGGRRLR